MLALGFHAFQSIAYMQGENFVELEARKDVPGTLVFATKNDRIHLGEAATDTCRDAGLYDREADDCICSSGACQTHTLAHMFLSKPAGLRPLFTAYGCARARARTRVLS